MVTPLEQSRLKAECAQYVADMKLTAERDRLTLASRKEAEAEERRSALRAATRRHREQLHRLRENRKSRIEQAERAKQIAFEDLRGQGGGAIQWRRELHGIADLEAKVKSLDQFSEDVERNFDSDGQHFLFCSTATLPVCFLACVGPSGWKEATEIGLLTQSRILAETLINSATMISNLKLRATFQLKCLLLLTLRLKFLCCIVTAFVKFHDLTEYPPRC